MVTMVEWHGYGFEVGIVGNRVVATCTRTGHQKLRLCADWWLNDQMERIQEPGLIDALEDGVRRLQSQQDKRRRYGRVSNLQTGPQRRGGVRMPRPKRREPRQNGRVSS